MSALILSRFILEFVRKKRVSALKLLAIGDEPSDLQSPKVRKKESVLDLTSVSKRPRLISSHVQEKLLEKSTEGIAANEGPPRRKRLVWDGSVHLLLRALGNFDPGFLDLPACSSRPESSHCLLLTDGWYFAVGCVFENEEIGLQNSIRDRLGPRGFLLNFQNAHFLEADETSATPLDAFPKELECLLNPAEFLKLRVNFNSTRPVGVDMQPLCASLGFTHPISIRIRDTRSGAGGLVPLVKFIVVRSLPERRRRSRDAEASKKSGADIVESEVSLVILDAEQLSTESSRTACSQPESCLSKFARSFAKLVLTGPEGFSSEFCNGIVGKRFTCSNLKRYGSNQGVTCRSDNCPGMPTFYLTRSSQLTELETAGTAEPRCHCLVPAYLNATARDVKALFPTAVPFIKSHFYDLGGILLGFRKRTEFSRDERSQWLDCWLLGEPESPKEKTPSIVPQRVSSTISESKHPSIQSVVRQRKRNQFGVLIGTVVKSEPAKFDFNVQSEVALQPPYQPPESNLTLLGQPRLVRVSIELGSGDSDGSFRRGLERLAFGSFLVEKDAKRRRSSVSTAASSQEVAAKSSAAFIWRNLRFDFFDPTMRVWNFRSSESDVKVGKLPNLDSDGLLELISQEVCEDTQKKLQRKGMLTDSD